MGRARFTPEQINGKLREAEVLLGHGTNIGEATRKLGVSEQTYCRWRKEYGGMRVDQPHLDCGNPRCGFARIRCPDCGKERLLVFSCRTRGFCPSCHAKRLNHPDLRGPDQSIISSII